VSDKKLPANEVSNAASTIVCLSSAAIVPEGLILNVSASAFTSVVAYALFSSVYKYNLVAETTLR
jgi:hypothetical protein